MKKVNFTEEQQYVIELALSGKNILVDACIGSGKTTTIQEIVNQIVSKSNKTVLYLTYNASLKADARKRIKSENVDVDSFNSFAYRYTRTKNMQRQLDDFLRRKPKIRSYDVLVLDEYQDVGDKESKILTYIKDCCRDIQIIAVGDMEQKIRTNSRLDIVSFLNNYLDNYEKLSLSICFRLSNDYVQKIAEIWHKQIKGANENCSYEKMSLEKAVEFLSNKNIEDILVLGGNKGQRAKIQNILEERYPDKFNKNTLYSSISDVDNNSVVSFDDVAYFITYDKCKGMERKYCVICDFTEWYWESRIKYSDSEFEQLRNLFMVAASRGSEKNIFVEGWGNSKFISKEYIESFKFIDGMIEKEFFPSDMFSFKYAEDIDELYNMLDITRVPVDDTSEIKAIHNDGLIDLSPVVGRYQEVIFFNKYDIDKELGIEIGLHAPLEIRNSKELPKYVESEKKRFGLDDKDCSLTKKLRVLAALDTGQIRYCTQVDVENVLDDSNRNKLVNRLGTFLDKSDSVQIGCGKRFDLSNGEQIRIKGYCDCARADVVYELKFVSDLSKEHFLQCALYIILGRYDFGRLWNTRNNEMYNVYLNEDIKELFLLKALETATKGKITSNNIISVI